MLYSTSAYVHDGHNDAYYYIKRQAVYLMIGLVACVVATFIDYHFWAKLWLPMLRAWPWCFWDSASFRISV